MRDSIWNFRITAILLISILLVGYIGTLPLDLLDIDSSQYGEIVRGMVESGNYGRIFDNGRKYLDKPILTFWIISPFFKLLGVNNVAYRIPAILVFLLGTLALFYIIKILYNNEKRAWIGSIAYMASPGVYAMILDPKIDIYLTTFLIFTHLFYFMGRIKNKKYFYLMYLSIGLGFITKGPISLAIPAISIGVDILIRRDWRLLLSMRILPGIVIVSIFPLYWSYLLYKEYSSYGPAFFLWIQSFGRFYKDMYDVGLDPLYFYITFIWSFGGLGLLLVLHSIYFSWRSIIQNKFQGIIKTIKESNNKQTVYVFGLWLYLFLFLISFSRFQLPQYVYWTLPAASVLFSGFFSLDTIERLRFKYLYSTLGIAFLIASIFILYIFYPDGNIYLWLPGLLVALLMLILVIGFKTIHKEFILLIGGTAIGFGVISLSIYPSLLEFQPSKAISKIVREIEPNEDTLYTYRISSSMRSIAFYSQRKFRNIYDKSQFLERLKTSKSRLVLVHEEHLPEMKNYLGGEVRYEVLGTFNSAKLAIPKKELFIHHKRDRVLKNLILVSVSI